VSIQNAPSGATEVTTAARVALLPLTPGYEASNHATYVKAIEDGLNGAVCNIALTGSYGVGKSSVLQEIATRHEKAVVQVSLSTLGLSDERKSDPASGAPVTKTNLIQKEIVKQLLYREDPAKMPGSRYRRIGRFKFWRGALEAALVGLAVTLLFFLAGWTKQLAALVPPDVKPGLYPHLVVFLAVTGFALALEWLFHNRIRVEKLSAGAATIALSGESGTYFDEYLDEIVYFFDVTGRDIVIFEDIDRFDDPHIFETLRALNSLLNRAGQLKGRRIRFIYAIKDSIFDELGVRAAREEGDIEAPGKPDAVDLEMARANRTKFFDLVIPVVPFITHRSARDLMDKVMKDSGSTISSELIDLSARYLVDMRLIKNVHNEFVIFREKVLGGEGTRLGLSEDALFAMMLYKSTHLSDFEDIKLGKSRIDRLYQDARQLVAQNMTSLSSEETAVRRRLANLDSVASRSTSLGGGLLKYIEQLERQSGASRTALRYARANVDPEYFKTSEFWEGFLSADEPVEAHLQTRNGYPVVFSIARQDIEGELRVSLSPQDWQKGDIDQLRERQQKIRKDREFLRAADMGDLFTRDEFKLVREEGEPCSLRELASEHLDSELARQLVASGYIDRNFTLYTSTYYANRVSSQATNFMIHSVDPDIMDPHFELAPSDVEAVIAERGDSVLRQRGMYNITVLDYLLEKNDKRVEPLIRSLMAGGEDGRQFLVSYFSNGNRQIDLVGRLAAAWPRTLQFILEDAEVDDSTRTSLVNVALRDIVGGIDYVVDDTIREFLELRYADFEVLNSDETSAERADIVAKLFTVANARLADLSRVAHNVRRSMVAQHRYTISRENLVVALDGSEALALDEIRAANGDVYAHVLNNLPAYLDALRAAEPSIAVGKPEDFETVLKDVSARDDGQLAQVISLSAPECSVQSLANVPEASWPFLADGNRFPATFANVRAYLGEAEAIDEHLAVVLKTSGTIEASEDATEAEKATLAESILRANDVLAEPDLRVQLVASLGLEDWLTLDSVPRESGQLIGLLVAAGIVADDADTFALTLDLDWKTRELAIGSSEDFTGYMTPTEVPVADVAPLLRSEIVPNGVKGAILARSAEFAPEGDRVALTALAEYALASGEPVAGTELSRWALARVDAPLIIRLLERLLPQVSLAELVPVLEALGGDYAAVSARTGRRPKLANTEADLALVKRLQELELASSYEISARTITVNMRKAP
jgi:hypothetical protein